MLKRLILLVFLVTAAAGGYIYATQNKNVLPEPAIQPSDAFSLKILKEKAKNLAMSDYQAPEENLPADIKNLNYDQYRDIRFVRESGPWYGQHLPFELQFFHVGSIFQYSVLINEIVDGKVEPIKYSAAYFDYGKNNLRNLDGDIAGYAGFRLHGKLNSPAYYDEIISFLGASYFRALGKGQKYGLSARGLAIDTALQTGEEFPIFKEFWLRKPTKRSDSIKIYALLDSPSVAGAYKFEIIPGKNTIVDVDAFLYPRKKITKLGVAPLTSMFLFGENTKNRFDDHRPEVHDSDGLLIHNGNDEWLWRPLDNSKYLRISSFEDNNPKGFGLLQRDDNREHYLDFEAYYEQRPSVWVQPQGNWGKGMVQLVEIPSIQEIHDNIVAYWVPEEEITAGKEYHFAYRLNWYKDIPETVKIAKVLNTYTGIGGVSGMLETDKRKFVVDFSKLPNTKADIASGKLIANVSTSEGKIKGIHMVYNPITKGATVYTDYQPNGKTAELRISLVKDGKTVSEVWSYQWLP